MKKVMMACALVVCVMGVQAQNVDFGLKGGLNLASWSANNNGAGYESRLGFHGGLLARFNVNSQLAIQPEVVYSSQGTKYNVGNLEHNLALNYVNIPVMIQAKLGRGFYAEAGPQIGFLTSVSDKVNDTETGFFDKNDFKDNDVALGFGFGYTGTSGFGVDARYNLGLSNINNAGLTNIKNNVLQVGVQLMLGGNGRR